MKIILLLSYICIASFSAAIITPALPAIGHYFSIPTNMVSWVVSVFLIGYVFGQLIYGPLAKRFSPMGALRIGLVINLLGIAICMLSVYTHSYPQLLIGRLITALGASGGLACTFMLMHQLLDEHEYKSAMGYAVVSFTVGIGLAVVIGGVVTQYWHWQGAFWLLLMHGAMMLALTWCFKPQPHEAQAMHPLAILAGYAKAIANPQLIIFSLVVGIMSAFSYVYSAVAPIFAQKSLGLSAAAYGYWNIINMVGMLIGGLLGGRLMTKIGPQRLMQLGFLGFFPCCVSLLLIATTHTTLELWFFLTTMFMYLFGGFLFPSGSYFALETTTDKANGSSMMSFINMSCATLSVIVVGFIPLPLILSFAILMLAVAAIAYSLARFTLLMR